MSLTLKGWKPCLRTSVRHALTSLRQGLSLNDVELDHTLREVLRNAPSEAVASDELLDSGQACVLEKYPNLEHDLQFRIRPIREQWDIAGPGLLRAIQRVVDPGERFAPPVVKMVHPFTGGHATLDTSANQIAFEAVLFNPHPSLPEVLRLGWATALLLSKQSDAESSIAVDVHATASAFASLTAAESVDLCSPDTSTLQLALRAWHVADYNQAQIQTYLDCWNDLDGAPWLQRLQKIKL